MNSTKVPLLCLISLGVICAVNGNPITSLFGKSNDDKAEVDEKTTTTTTTVKPVEAAGQSTSCGGLKGFLHICEKEEPADPKTVKTRSAPENEDSSEEDSDEESDEESEEKKESKESAVEKRQVEDTEKPLLGSEPIVPPEVLADAVLEKRQAEPETEESEESVETEEETEERKRRDCRDREGDYDKDCRKKRELVPLVEPKPKKETTESS